MNFILLITAILVLLFSLRQMTMIEKSTNKSDRQEFKQNIRLLLCGIPAIVALAFIPYQVWVLTGKSTDWNGVYIIGGTAIISIIISFVFYYKGETMKKTIFGIVVVITMVVSVFVYLENSKKNNSYSTPEVALSNVENPKLDVLEIIDTKFYDNVAYVCYYSEVGETPKNYLAVGKINKNKYGWRLDEIIGVGNIDSNNAGMSSGRDHYIVGLASKEVDKVKLGSHEAEMITMEKKDMKAFLLNGVKPVLMTQTDFEYFDKEGNELPY